MAIPDYWMHIMIILVLLILVFLTHSAEGLTTNTPHVTGTEGSLVVLSCTRGTGEAGGVVTWKFGSVNIVVLTPVSEVILRTAWAADVFRVAGSSNLGIYRLRLDRDDGIFSCSRGESKVTITVTVLADSSIDAVTVAACVALPFGLVIIILIVVIFVILRRQRSAVDKANTRFASGGNDNSLSDVTSTSPRNADDDNDAQDNDIVARSDVSLSNVTSTSPQNADDDNDAHDNDIGIYDVTSGEDDVSLHYDINQYDSTDYPNVSDSPYTNNMVDDCIVYENI